MSALHKHWNELHKQHEFLSSNPKQMSRDSSHTYIHLHASRHADLFEEFNTPPTTNSSASATSAHHGNAQCHPAHLTQPMSLGTNPFSVPTAPGHTTLLPNEDLDIPAQHQPINPEDEDDVVPDQHAAFGITRAMAAREGRERAWRDFEGMEALVRGDSLPSGEMAGATGTTSSWGGTRLR